MPTNAVKYWTGHDCYGSQVDIAQRDDGAFFKRARPACILKAGLGIQDLGLGNPPLTT